MGGAVKGMRRVGKGRVEAVGKVRQSCIEKNMKMAVCLSPLCSTTRGKTNKPLYKKKGWEKWDATNQQASEGSQ